MRYSFSRAVTLLLFFLWGSGMSAAQASAPVKVSGELHPPSTRTYHPSTAHADNTSRGLLVITNEVGSQIKDVSIESRFFHPDGELLYTDLQKANLKSGANDVFVMWANPSRALVDRVEVTVFGTANGRDFQVEKTLKAPLR